MRKVKQNPSKMLLLSLAAFESQWLLWKQLVKIENQRLP
jgi:hypothetical protein